MKAFSKENIETRFEVTGIFPFNRNIFKDEEFLSSYVTDRPEAESAVLQPLSTEGQTLADDSEKTDDIVNGHDKLNSNTQVTQTDINQPLTSTANSCVKPILPELNRPFPKAGPRKTNPRERQPGKSSVDRHP